MESSIANVSAYLASWGSELSARQNRVRNLIGNAHWLSDGNHKEAILRDFLARYLPQEAECSTGFIRGADWGQSCSPEIDILLFSRRIHVPYFSEGGICIVDPSSVLANIEVKSTFAVGALTEAIENIKRTRSLIGNRLVANVWSGLFFYDLPESRTMQSAVETLGERLRQLHANEESKDFLPTCVVLGQNCLAFPSFDESEIKIRAFQGAGFAFASGICDLLGFISSRLNGAGISGFEEWGASGEFMVFEKKF
ncbi:DUF6602 domain-containing protein [Variovorax paradoxus]|uniref:DUF6602 domain-containing protein n=1 Tax=Variovorax paradoxus TaxID=34073 RepID=A0A0H2M5V0_VARPD|nr:DUF6602 domain-containing protein [Variovorax paradoxus]KLN57516.1 hypothetical protein VPARA_15970 [Variovorax paradoxus]